MLQRIIKTAPNRYPGIFRTARAHIAAKRGPDLGEGRLRILSFGCSTGIEMLSIRAYFPDATIFGCDVNPLALNAAVKNTRDDACRIFLSSPAAITANGPYDLIFAMSVFCQYPDSSKVDNLEKTYPFGLYEMLAGNLLENLSEGGLLCLMNSNYLFRDLPQADGFDRVRSPLIAGNGFIDKFARNGMRLTTSFGNKYGYSHRREAANITDDDLRDCIFKKGPAGHAGGGILTEESFLRMAPPDGLRQITSLPDQGESLDKAITGRRSAMARRTDVYAEANTNDPWVRHEWLKSTLDGGKANFGGWWLPVSRELAGELTAAQAAQAGELSGYLKQSKSLGARLKRLFGR